MVCEAFSATIGILQPQGAQCVGGGFHIRVSLRASGLRLLKIGFRNGAVREKILRANVKFVGEGVGVIAP